MSLTSNESYETDDNIYVSPILSDESRDSGFTERDPFSLSVSVIIIYHALIIFVICRR